VIEREALLDTDTLSLLMRKDPRASIPARLYLVAHERLTFSLITRFEILRGLKAKAATNQLAAFERLCLASRVIPVTDEVIVRASDIYAHLRQVGALIPDADLLIASTALVHGFAVVTNNTSHFSRVPELTVHNWVNPT
jgi:tRNA(fMet)-specific endonuclease VapC